MACSDWGGYKAYGALLSCSSCRDQGWMTPAGHDWHVPFQHLRADLMGGCRITKDAVLGHRGHGVRT